MRQQRIRRLAPYIAFGLILLCSAAMIFMREYRAAAIIAAQAAWVFLFSLSAVRSAAKRRGQ